MKPKSKSYMTRVLRHFCDTFVLTVVLLNCVLIFQDNTSFQNDKEYALRLNKFKGTTKTSSNKYNILFYMLEF